MTPLGRPDSDLTWRAEPWRRPLAASIGIALRSTALGVALVVAVVVVGGIWP